MMHLFEVDDCTYGNQQKSHGIQLQQLGVPVRLMMAAVNINETSGITKGMNTRIARRSRVAESLNRWLDGASEPAPQNSLLRFNLVTLVLLQRQKWKHPWPRTQP